MEEPIGGKRKADHLRKASFGSSDEDDFTVISQQPDKGVIVLEDKRLRVQDGKLSSEHRDEGSDMDVGTGALNTSRDEEYVQSVPNDPADSRTTQHCCHHLLVSISTAL